MRNWKIPKKVTEQTEQIGDIPDRFEVDIHDYYSNKEIKLVIKQDKFPFFKIIDGEHTLLLDSQELMYWLRNL